MAINENDLLYVTNPTDKPFSVKWAGEPYTLMPGEQKIWQRFLAEHFAKHLTDFILLRREYEHKKAYLAKGLSEKDYIPKSYLNSRIERPKVLESILKGVYSYHKQHGVTDPNVLLQQQIDRVNQQAQPQQSEPPAIDLGRTDDNRLGSTAATEFDDNDEEVALMQAASGGRPPIPNIPIATELDTKTPDTLPQQPRVSDAVDEPAVAQSQSPPAGPADLQAAEAPKMKRDQLFREAKQLGIKVPFSATNDQIRDLIIKQNA